MIDLLERLEGVKPNGDDGWLARCPAHPDKSPSLSVGRAPDRWWVNCFAGCEAADVAAATGLALYELLDERSCLECSAAFQPRHPTHALCGDCFRPGTGKASGTPARHEPPLQPVPEPEVVLDPARLARLQAIWARTQPLADSLGETYLRYRRCALPPADSHVRFLPVSESYPPSLCGLVTHATTGEPLSLHFTRLRADGLGKDSDDARRPLKGFPMRGGVIRVWPNEAVTRGLGIGEGIETALAAAHAFTPVWSVIDAGHMSKFPVLDGIESLVIFADHDDAGIKAARTCAQRWADAGRDVRIVLPEQAGTDIADMVAA